MGCNCGKNKLARQKYIVQLRGGLKVEKTSETAATAFAAKHPGSKVIKPGS